MGKPFEEIVAECGPVVLRVCRAVLHGADAEDAWSETFLAALRAYPDLPAGTNMQAWLVTVAHRKAIDQHRARARRPVPTDELPEQASQVGIPGSGRPELWEALGSLPTKQRFAVAYHYLAGLPYAEIADLLGNNESAARRAAADGIATLRHTFSVASPDSGATTNTSAPSNVTASEGSS
jgi:RNA polymerase sigma factor (sigma-70 family)